MDVDEAEVVIEPIAPAPVKPKFYRKLNEYDQAVEDSINQRKEMMQELNITEQELVSASNKIYRDNLNEKDKEGAE